MQYKGLLLLCNRWSISCTYYACLWVSKLHILLLKVMSLIQGTCRWHPDHLRLCSRKAHYLGLSNVEDLTIRAALKVSKFETCHFGSFAWNQIGADEWNQSQVWDCSQRKVIQLFLYKTCRFRTSHWLEECPSIKSSFRTDEWNRSRV